MGEGVTPGLEHVQERSVMRAGRVATAEPGERATLGERVGQQETTGIEPTGGGP